MRETLSSIQSLLKRLFLTNIIASFIAILWITTISIWTYREFGWRKAQVKCNNEITSLMDLNQNLLQQITIEKRAIDNVDKWIKVNSSCVVVEADGECIQPSIEVAYSPTPDAKTVANVFPESVYFTKKALIQIVIISSMCAVEFFGFYSNGLNSQFSNSANSIITKELMWKMRMYIAKYHPIVSTIFCVCMLLMTSAAWLGILPSRTAFVTEALHWILSLYLSSILMFFVHNAIDAYSYLAKTFDTLKQSTMTLSWWQWLIGRVFGLWHPSTAPATLLWFGCSFFFILPIRYFFYYRYEACAVDERNHVFFINMIAHIMLNALLCELCYMATVSYSFLHADVLLHSSTTSDDKGHCDAFNRSFKSQKMSFLQKALDRQLSSLQKQVRSDRFLGVLTLLFIANTVLMILRILYFYFTGKCTFYAGLMILNMLSLQVALILYVMPALNMLMQRLKIDEKFRKDFVDKFVDSVEKSQSQSKSARKNEEEVTHTKEKEAQNEKYKQLKLFSANVYDSAMLKSILFCIFTDLTELKQEASKQREGNDQEDIDALFLVFPAVLQTEAVGMKQDESDTTKDAQPNVSSDDNLGGNSSVHPGSVDLD